MSRSNVLEVVEVALCKLDVLEGMRHVLVVVDGILYILDAGTAERHATR